MKTLYQWARSLYRTPDLARVIADELDEARLALLRAESAVEFAQSDVDYNRARVARLEQYQKEAV